MPRSSGQNAGRVSGAVQKQSPSRLQQAGACLRGTQEEDRRLAPGKPGAFREATGIGAHEPRPGKGAVIRAEGPSCTAKDTERDTSSCYLKFQIEARGVSRPNHPGNGETDVKSQTTDGIRRVNGKARP